MNVSRIHVGWIPDCLSPIVTRIEMVCFLITKIMITVEHGKGIQLILQRVSDVWRDDTVNPFYKQYDYYISEWNVEITTENKKSTTMQCFLH